MPPFRLRVDLSEEEEPEGTVWPPRCPHIKFGYGAYEQKENAEPAPPRRWKKARLLANPFIDAEAGVGVNECGDQRTDDVNDYVDGLIVVEY